MTHDCPICTTPTESKLAENSPYWLCPNCACAFQDPPPPKVFHGPDEPDIGGMSAADRAVNKALARHLCDVVMRDKMVTHTLDIGSKIPALADELSELGGFDTYVMDPKGDPPAFGQLLPHDFETFKVPALRGNYPSHQFAGPTLPIFDLITLIHCFEHFYDPLAALRKLRLLVNDDGRVFMRLPDHRVPGWERDLTPHHYAIHPFYHTTTSILEALSRSGNLFVVESRVPMVGSGQCDIVLRPIRKAPRLACAMIVKNEEVDLPRCLRSLKPIGVDNYAIIDTGSTDRTMIVAHSTIDAKIVTSSYLGASKRNEAGDWQLWDFAAARNFSLEVAERSGADWVMWADADDEIKTPAAIRRAMYWDEHDVFGIWIDGGGSRWVQQRLWKSHKNVRFQGRCHEYPLLDGLSGGQIDDGLIVHHADARAGQENSNPRNLRILALEWEEGPNPRTAFYMANTYRDAGRNEEAAQWYRKRIELEGYDHERLFAYLYGARCLRALGDHEGADEMSGAALARAPSWSEFAMELAHGAYLRKEYARAIEHAAKIDTKALVPYTALWREHSMYRDQAPRLISWCHEHEGRIGEAIAWADVAAQLIGHPDADWDRRRMRLMAQLQAEASRPMEAPAVVKRARQMIALHRPGAIGDILMTLNLVPALKAANPDADVHYFCSAGLAAPDALGTIILAAGCNAVLDCAGLPAWRKGYDRVIDLVGYPLQEGYPERPMRRHLLEYFADEMGLHDFGCGGKGSPLNLASLTLQRPALPDPLRIGLPVSGDEYATLQVKAGWSHYKEWPIARWSQVIKALPFQIQMVDENRGLTLSQSIALFANARMHLGIDSFCNHLTNYFWQDAQGNGRRVPGVILWGSTQFDAAGYEHNTNISKGLYCQPCFRETAEWSKMKRPPCINVAPSGTHSCMDIITVESVIEFARVLWGSVNEKE